MPPLQKVRCRPIEDSDLGSVADLLTQGFPERTRKYWTNALGRLAGLDTPEGCPRFGYLLDVDGAAVGVLLLIFSHSACDAEGPIRCNVSSWYVDPAYRGYAAALVSAALKLKQVTYLNISPADHTWPILHAQGYRRYSEGQQAALPLFGRHPSGYRARALTDADRSLPEYPLLRDHVGAGCIAIVCETPEGPQPFLFLRRRMKKAPFGLAQLVYCRSTDEFVRCAGPLGRRLALVHAIVFVLCDSLAAIPGLVGPFFGGRTPRYFRGPQAPRLNDLSFTELVLFGP
jgi:hypothetical protein